MRDFNTWLGQFKQSIANYRYYTDFDKVNTNVDAIRIELNILNSLIGSPNIESDFEALVLRYPEVLKCIPILIAKREREIRITESSGSFCYDFANANLPIEQYRVFMRETGLFELLASNRISNLLDYVTGVEVGLDSNARKNRGGHLMEDLIESYLQVAGFVRDESYFKEMYIHQIEQRWNVDLSCISNRGTTEKRFDFVVKTPRMIYGVETNFYASKGSKLNETARSYKNIALETNALEGFAFVWFTDGCGWNNARHNLEETFGVLEHIYNIHEIEGGIMQQIFR